MRIWLGEASNWLSFSSQTCQPSLAFRKAIGSTTTLLSGRMTQPEQDWLPISIPHTYLIVVSSLEEASSVKLISHLPLLVLSHPWNLYLVLSFCIGENPNQSR